MKDLQAKFLPVLLICIAVFYGNRLTAEQIPVRNLEGVTLGFLVLRTLDGHDIAYGQLQQVVKSNDEPVTDDLQFRFKDGSFYEEITKFTQHGVFRLVSDQVVQKGPSFKQESETWIDASTGKITIRTIEKGKEKLTNKHLDLPPDVSNGLLLTLAKNVDPAAPETTVSMVVASTRPRVVKLNFFPAQEKTIKVGLVTKKVQHYVIKVKIEGAAGVIAPLIGKQPPDIHIWLVKSEAPTLVEMEGPLSQDSPVWRLEMMVPEPDSPRAK
ncbi:MAG TPA: hypothetical protein VFA74_07665 [Terriglobales bacterium]|nr:hypothetical protein [Terriglobales bacterium]